MASGRMKSMLPPASRPSTIRGSVPRRSPTCRCHCSSHPKVWKGVASAAASRARQSCFAGCRLENTSSLTPDGAGEPAAAS
jgi:hypothetical protein